MLIMAWAHAKFSGDSSLLNRYVRVDYVALSGNSLNTKYSTFQSWATYLAHLTAAPTGL